MKIAAITIFCDEHFRMDAWRQYYEEYKDDLYLHVIVNNGNPEDMVFLQERFPESLVLFSPTRNMMASYNLALKTVLKDPEVDAVAQIVNDIRLSPRAFSTLYGYLEDDPTLAMVSPVLLRKDSEIVDCYGCTIDPRTLDFIHEDAGCDWRDNPEEFRLVSGLPAGVFLARRSLYEQFGFQDEKLEMYSDEVDMGIRVARLGYRLGATNRARAWHQHVNPGGAAQRNPHVGYLMGRNQVYIAGKYFSKKMRTRVSLHMMIRGLDEVRSAVMHRKGRDFRRFGWQMLRGAFAGLRMNP